MLLELTVEEVKLLLNIGEFDLYIDSVGGGYYTDYRCPSCYESIELSDSKSEGADIVHKKECKLEDLKRLHKKLLDFVNTDKE